MLLSIAKETRDAGLLHAELRRRAEAGTSRAAALAELASARDELRNAGNEQAENAVLEAMDFVQGWCAPHMRIEFASEGDD